MVVQELVFKCVSCINLCCINFWSIFTNLILWLKCSMNHSTHLKMDPTPKFSKCSTDFLAIVSEAAQPPYQSPARVEILSALTARTRIIWTRPAPAGIRKILPAHASHPQTSNPPRVPSQHAPAPHYFRPKSVPATMCLKIMRNSCNVFHR